MFPGSQDALAEGGRVLDTFPPATVFLNIVLTASYGDGLGPPRRASRQIKMFITIQALEEKPLDFREEFQPQALDLGPEVEQQTPLTSSGRAELVEEHEGRKVVQDIRVVGGFATRIAVRCARCLEPVASDLKSSFDLLYRPRGIEGRGPDTSISEAETEISFYSGDGLLLEDVLKEQVLLAVPLKALCREDCQGLCPGCGINRNRERCDCAPPAGDERWAELGKIRERLKS